MKTCDKCNITIATNHDHCPLCHQTLRGDMPGGFEERYPPKEPLSKRTTKALRIIVFSCLVAILTLGTINLLTAGSGFWSIIPIGALIYLMMLMRLSVFTRSNAVRRISGLTVTLILLIVFLNLVTDRTHLWSIDYVIPSLIITNNIIFFLIMTIRRQGIQDYASCFLLMLVLSLVPIVLYWIGIATVLPMVVITLAHEALLVLFLFVFYPKMMTDMFKQMFHF